MISRSPGNGLLRMLLQPNFRTIKWSHAMLSNNIQPSRIFCLFHTWLLVVWLCRPGPVRLPHHEDWIDGLTGVVWLCQAGPARWPHRESGWNDGRIDCTRTLATFIPLGEPPLATLRRNHLMAWHGPSHAVRVHLCVIGIHAGHVRSRQALLLRDGTILVRE